MSFLTGHPGILVADHLSGHSERCAMVFRLSRPPGLLVKRSE
jgi:hypothetical protein